MRAAQTGRIAWLHPTSSLNVDSSPLHRGRAQATRAILFASATAATLAGLRASNCASQGCFSG